MKRIGRAVIEFVVGDDIWIAVALAVLLAVAAALVRIGGEAWWLLPVGVPATLWVSLLRARRRTPR